MTHELTGYELKDIERLVCEDDSTAELGVHLSLRAGQIFVRGRVASHERRDRVLALVAEHCPGVPLVDELGLDEDGLSRVPAHSEEIA